MTEVQGVPDVEPGRRRRGFFGRGDADAVAPNGETAHELCERATRLEEDDRSEDALPVFREVIVRFGKDTRADVRERVAFALLRTGLILRFLHRKEESMAALGALLKRFPKGESELIDEHLELARERYQLMLHPGPWR